MNTTVINLDSDDYKSGHRIAAAFVTTELKKGVKIGDLKIPPLKDGASANRRAGYRDGGLDAIARWNKTKERRHIAKVETDRSEIRDFYRRQGYSMLHQYS
ncbi:MAG: hypothetical protein LBL21_01420 [Rickettsiales bacterium]|jgi:hypothetical protein|nr:hypothetical protein [Rickettsiales bacterium]